MNLSFSALDRHVIDGRGEQAALISKNSISGESLSFTYAELLERVAKFAGVLHMWNVQEGDRVIIVMPNVAESVIAQLGCIRIGVNSDVVNDLGEPAPLAQLIDEVRPKIIVSASCGIEESGIVEYKTVVDVAIENAQHKPAHCVILQRSNNQRELGERDLDWVVAMRAAEPVTYVPMTGTMQTHNDSVFEPLLKGGTLVIDEAMPRP